MAQQWSCHRCTYVHQYPAQRCSMCSALRVSKQQMIDFVVSGKKIDDGSSEKMSPPSKRAKGAAEEATDPMVESSSTEPDGGTADSSSSLQPRRLGLLQCPNAESLGWGGGESAAAHVNSGSSGDLAAPNMDSEEPNDTRPMAIDGNDAGISNEPTALKSGDSRDTSCVQVAKEIASNVDLSPSEYVGNRQDVGIVNDEGTPSKKKPRLLNPTCPPQTLVTQTHDAKDKDNDLIDANEEEMSETEEVMKGGEDNDADLSTTQPTTNDTEPIHLSVTLDYEPMVNESVGRSQILTVTYHGSGGSNSLTSNSSTVVGVISGKARLELLSPLAENNETQNSISPTATECQPEISLDVFGYRLQQQRNNGNAMYSENNHSIIINRPDWMNALPISIICQNLNQAEAVKPPVILRVRIQSLTNENNTETASNNEVGAGECYYSAYPEESYQLNVLPPNAIYPENYTAAGSGVCTLLKPWKEALDTITEGMMDYVNNTDGNSKTDSIEKMNNASGMDDIKQQKTPLENHNRILLCGAKGVGKSTLLRYATNRILSISSSCNAETSNSSSKRYPRRVAILDLDCGQAELSPPGMLTLTVVSRPLISDPPVHMVCGGSCDHSGRKIDQNQDEEDYSVKHQAAYFFGDITSKADPDTYIQMASQLFRRYEELKKQEGNSTLPLLVNTDGWVKGLGYEILSAIIGCVNPGHIVQIMGNTKAKSFDMSSHSSGPTDSAPNDQYPPQPKLIHVIPSFDESSLPALDDDNRSCRSINSSSSTTALLASAGDHRVHRLCAYFLGGHDEMMNLRSQIPGANESICFHKEKGLHDPNNIVGLTLASMLPYAVPFHSVQVYPPPGLLDSISEIKPLWGVQGDLACSDLLDSLNGSIVGLCSKPDAYDVPLSSCNAGTGVPILNCVGLGIIRSIDHIRRIFFVLTPVHPRLLENVTSFVGGNINLPLECVYRGVHSDSFPFLSFGHTLTTASLGAEMMKSRNHSRGKK